MTTSKVFLYYNTVKYLKLSQIFYRSFFILKKKIIFKSYLWKNFFLKEVEREIKGIKKITILNFSESIKTISSKEIERISFQRKLLLNKEFEFLNIRKKFEENIIWDDSNFSQLWRYNLHYFNYFRSLIESENISPNYENFELLKFYIKSWVKSNQKVGEGDGWHSYTISLRLTNWIFAYSIFEHYIKKDKKFNELFIKSIVTQSIFLARNQEYDVLGNHLFENCKTLIICGMFFRESSLGDKLIKAGEKEMEIQLKEQFLEDGGHFELSAMYHSIMLRGITELIYVYRNLKQEVPIELITAQKKAITYLYNITHPDGNIPLFNDAAFGIADHPRYLKKFLSVKNEESLSLTVFDKLLKKEGNTLDPTTFQKNKNIFYAKESGYLRTSDKLLFLIMDIGKPCPDYLPAHAHADIFSYELSFNGKRLVVDTGTFEYAGLKRSLDRATESHNTLTINNENQSQVWGNFRVAKRGIPTVHFLQVNNDYLEMMASHNGYLKRFDTLHTRKLIHVFNEVLIILDYVKSENDVKSFMHFNPESEISFSNESTIITNDLINIKAINSTFDVENSVYHPEFGVEIKNLKIVIKPKEPKVFGYALLYGNSNIEIFENKVFVTKDEKTLSFSIEMEK